MIDEATKEYIEQHRNEDAEVLALQKKPAGVDALTAMQQIAAYKTAKVKVPTWAGTEGIVYPKQLSMEQCSSEETAAYKRDLIREEVGKENYTMADLTGGMGVDFSFAAQNASEAHYVESDETLCKTAAHNFETLRKSGALSSDCNIEIHNESAEGFVEKHKDMRVDIIYADPDRRGKSGQKLVSIKECQPDMTTLLPTLLTMAGTVVVKLSPMLDIQKAVGELENVKRVVVVSAKGECKELIAVIQRSYNAEASITATDIKDGMCSVHVTGSMAEEKAMSVVYADPMQYLYEPHAAYLKSGLFKTIAKRFGVEKISQHAHLYTSDTLVEDFPGRVFRIERCVEFNKREMKQLTSVVPKANITTRHFPICANDLHKQYKIKDGGDTYLFATTTAGEKKVILVCSKIRKE